jgi:hypothetical protein
MVPLQVDSKPRPWRKHSSQTALWASKQRNLTDPNSASTYWLNLIANCRSGCVIWFHSFCKSSCSG